MGSGDAAEERRTARQRRGVPPSLAMDRATFPRSRQPSGRETPLWRDPLLLFSGLAGLFLALGHYLALLLCPPGLGRCSVGLAPLLGIWSGWVGTLLGVLLLHRPGRRGTLAAMAGLVFWLVWLTWGALWALGRGLLGDVAAPPLDPGWLLSRLWFGTIGASFLGLAVLAQVWMGALFALAYHRLVDRELSLGEGLLLWGIGLVAVGLVDGVAALLQLAEGGASWPWIGLTVLGGLLLTLVGAGALAQRRWWLPPLIYLAHLALVFLTGLGGMWTMLVALAVVEVQETSLPEAGGFALLGLFVLGGLALVVWLVAILVDLVLTGAIMAVGTLMGAMLRE